MWSLSGIASSTDFEARPRGIADCSNSGNDSDYCLMLVMVTFCSELRSIAQTQDSCGSTFVFRVKMDMKTQECEHEAA